MVLSCGRSAASRRYGTVSLSMRSILAFAASLIFVAGCSSDQPILHGMSSMGESVVLLKGESCLSPVGCKAPVLKVRPGKAAHTSYYAAFPLSVHMSSTPFELTTVDDYWAILPLAGEGEHVLTIYVTGESYQVVLKFK